MRAKLFFSYLLSIFIFACGSLLLWSQEKQPMALEDIFASNKLQGKTVAPIQWSPDGSSFSYAEQNPETGLLNIYEHEVKTSKKTLLIEGKTLTCNNAPLRMSSYKWTNDRKYLLIAGPLERTWQNFTQAPYYIYNVSEKKLMALAENDGTLRNVILSPDGRYVGYIRKFNIFITDLATGETRALTADGNPNILNGIFDYNNNLEIGTRDAWLWSPDSKKIAFWRTDQSQVKISHIIDEMPCYNVIRELKYANAGEKNSEVTVGVVDIQTGKTIWMDVKQEGDFYISRLNWTRLPQTLAIQRLSRSHQKLDLLLADITTGKAQVIAVDTDPCWIDVTNDLTFFEKKDLFLWTSEKSGFRQIYVYDYKGNLVRQITNLDWEISSLAEFDEQGSWIYFYGKRDSAINQHIYRIKLDGKGLEQLSQKPGWYQWNFAPGAKYAIEFFSDARIPTRVSLREANGKMVRMLEENKIEAFENYRMVHPEFLKFKTSDGVELDAYMIKPADFDPSKKYPVIVYGYGNAGSQTVVNRWEGNRALWHRLMTEKGFIIFSLDNRTSAGRSKKSKNLSYLYYGKYTLKDEIEGAKYLTSLPYVDSSRIGIWGWSGGGYLTCMLMTKAADYFKTGVSVAPVIDLRCYQSIGVERWMGLPQDNPEGYEYVNLLNFAHLLRGSLLLIHGTGDENVKPAYTLHFANALIAAGKQFDLMLYPNRHHDLSGGNTLLHVYTKITNYFLKNL